MQANTITTIGQLRIGDRFVPVKIGLLKKKVNYASGVWQVTALANKRGYVAANIFSEVSDRKYLKEDQLLQKNREVKFIRHSKPLPGEFCMVVDLLPGDIFQMPNDHVHEYEFISRRTHFADVRRTDQASCIKGGIYAKVIFLRHKEKK